MAKRNPADEPQLLKVGEVARLTGATPAQLKNWDNLGVLRVRRSGEGVSNNRKLYTLQDVDRVRTILLLKDTGLSLQEIKAILDASQEEQRAIIAARSEELRRQYTQLHRSIALSSIMQVGGTESLRAAANAGGDYEALRDSYAQDEGLKGLLRWLKSHTDREVERFSRELSRIADGFDALAGSADWHQLELQVADFCDLLERYFIWPSAGYMLTLHWAFSEDSPERREIAGFLGESTTEFMGQAFLLAWLSCALESVDEILAFLHRRMMHAQTAEDAERAARIAANVLCASVCEFGTHPRLYDAPASPERTAQLTAMTHALFALLEDTALDEEVSRYLDVDELDAIDGPAMETARALTIAFIEGRLHEWLEDGGIRQLEQRRDEWLESLMAGWLSWALEERGEEGFERWTERLGTEGIREEFDLWFREWFEDAYPDEPEACWATQEESCTREKNTREAMEQARLQGES